MHVQGSFWILGEKMDITPIKSRNIWAYILEQSPGEFEAPADNDVFSSWDANNAFIDTINVQTASTNWDLYIYQKQDDSGEQDISNFTQIANNLNGNQILHPNIIYENESNKIYFLYADNSGNEPCSLYIKGELREKNINNDRTSYWNQSKTSTYTANLAKPYYEYTQRNIYIIAENLSSTVYALPRSDDPASWGGKCSFISTIKVITTSKNYDIYLYENEDYDDAADKTIKIASNLCLNNEIELNMQYKSIANLVYLKIIDNDGQNSFNLYVFGKAMEKRNETAPLPGVYPSWWCNGGTGGPQDIYCPPGHTSAAEMKFEQHADIESNPDKTLYSWNWVSWPFSIAAKRTGYISVWLMKSISFSTMPETPIVEIVPSLYDGNNIYLGETIDSYSMEDTQNNWQQFVLYITPAETDRVIFLRFRGRHDEGSLYLAVETPIGY